MYRRIALFVGITVAAFLVGYFVFIWKIADESNAYGSRIPQTPNDPPSISESSALNPPVANDAPSEPGGLVVISTVGQVSHRNSVDTDWQAVESGDRLADDESIKTGSDASVKLSVNEKSQIELAHRSELTVREIAAAVHKFNLVRGRIQVDYDEDAERVLSISAAQSDAVAKTKMGQFTMQNTNQTVSVATTSGEVDLSAQNKTVKVQAGQISTVFPDQAPVAAAPIPVDILLRVAKPKRFIRNKLSTSVSGQTGAGVRVYVNNRETPVAQDGRFETSVPLQLGKNNVVVRAEDVVGNTQIETLPEITVEKAAKKPDQVHEVRVRWKQRKN